MSSHAQFEALERVMMPGPVITAHAEYESQCTNCHARFSRGEQRDLCIACHTEIAEDLQTGTGFHSLSPDVADQTCASCHTEHVGRDADVVALVEDDFDHGLTDFLLRDSHVEAACADCHVPDEPFHPLASTCVSCHLEDDTHMGNLGEQCQDCHRETEWADAFYDHEVDSGYALTGAHAQASCVSCHVEEVYVDTPTECVGCHREDDSHLGNNGSDCQDCHTTNDWTETLFDHFARTGFALTGSHAGVDCDSCHEGNNKFLQSPSSDCYSCHREDDHHDGINGTVCSDCHRATEWLDVLFDHAVDTEFPLNGSHARIECADCHVEEIAVALPETECVGCHADDEPHEGQLGTDCASCHAEVVWDEGVRFDHDLAAFPLLGQHALNQCEDCHATPAFHDASDVCVDCHMEDDAHEAKLGADCAVCHTPIEWLLWTFDHAAQTDFALEGAHDGLQCESCHKTPAVDGSIAVSMTCISCHRGDDVHRGRFGADCAECHTPESFDALRVAQ